MKTEADVVIIGGGITGTAILSQLSHYNLNIILVEKEPDIATGTTKANSGIIHAGFDATPGSLKATMNVRGNALYHALCRELNLEIKWLGSLVVALNAKEVKTIEELYIRGQTNAVPGLEIWEGKRILAQEPNLNKGIIKGLWAPSAGVCCPFNTAQAFAENAVLNGASIRRNCAVTGFCKQNNVITGVQTSQGIIKTKYVINAAGIASGEISHLAGDTSFSITTRKGEYLLFDKAAADLMTKGIIFPTPDPLSKGILVCTTFHGNVFIGPNAQDVDDHDNPNNTAVTASGMAEIIDKAKKILPELPLDLVITEFAGLRAVASTGDFVLGKSQTIKGLLQAAGIQSPGLSSAPAIGEFITKIIVAESGAKLKNNYIKGRPDHPIFAKLTTPQQQMLIGESPSYGRVICRCETITEGEILDAIHRPCGARTMDGVKRRTRAGMGRCQGGFCGPRVAGILAGELNIPLTDICKETANSQLYCVKPKLSKEGNNEHEGNI